MTSITPNPETDGPKETGAPAAQPEAAAPPTPETASPPTPLIAEAVAEPATPPIAEQPAVDLTLNPSYQGLSFVEATWNWPSVVRAAIYLCDYLAADEARFAQPLLPGHIALDNDGQLQVRPVAAGDAVPFMAAEVRAGAVAGEAAAVYHVAAVVYYLLVGYPPLGNVAHVNRAAPDTPAALKNVLLPALAVDPQVRPATLVELRSQLYFVLVPPTWFEEWVPQLPLSNENKAQLTDTLNRLQLTWFRLRDRVPWQRLGQMRKRVNDATARPNVRRALRLAGIFVVLVIYLTLLTDII